LNPVSGGDVFSCPTFAEDRRCRFPFWFQGQLRFECIPGTQDKIPRCPTAVDEASLEVETELFICMYIPMNVCTYVHMYVWGGARGITFLLFTNKFM
jgi:hypothetical protein